VIHFDVVAFDVHTHVEEVLARLGDVSVSDAKVNVYSYSFGADVSTGVVYIGSRICDSVASFDANGIHPIDFRIGTDATSPNLADPFTKPCQDTINARSAVLTPDGSQIGLFIAEGAKGRSGQDRLRAKWDLVVIRPSDSTLTHLISDLQDPHDLRWSPNGRWLAFGDTADSGASTTELVRSDTRENPIRLDLDDHLTGLAWAPNGRAILALADRTAPGGDDDAKAVPVIVDVSELVGQ
jgi:hypothetical protein